MRVHAATRTEPRTATRPLPDPRLFPHASSCQAAGPLRIVSNSTSATPKRVSPINNLRHHLSLCANSLIPSPLSFAPNGFPSCPLCGPHRSLPSVPSAPFYFSFVEWKAQGNCVMFSPSSSPSQLPLINSADASFELEVHRRRAFLGHRHTRTPDDLEEVERALNSCRDSPEPDGSYLASFQRRLRNSCNEAAVVQGVMPKLVPIDQLLDREDVVTVPNQQWDKECSLPVPPSAQYRIPPPKPDQTVGLAASNFTAYETALAHLSHAARPIRSLSDLTFPLLTIEAKGDKGHNVCRSQNLHNAGVMLHQLLRLWEHTGNAEDLFGQSLVYTISITTQTCAVSHYWMESGPSGVAVYGRLFKSWTLNLQEPIDLGAIIRCIRNAIEFAINRGTGLIRERLELLEDELVHSSSPPCSPGCYKRRLVHLDGLPSPERESPTRRKTSHTRRSRRSDSRRFSSRRFSGNSTC
jgi:hypothetical protein